MLALKMLKVGAWTGVVLLEAGLLLGGHGWAAFLVALFVVGWMGW